MDIKAAKLEFKKAARGPRLQRKDVVNQCLEFVSLAVAAVNFQDPFCIAYNYMVSDPVVWVLTEPVWPSDKAGKQAMSAPFPASAGSVSFGTDTVFLLCHRSQLMKH